MNQGSFSRALLFFLSFVFLNTSCGLLKKNNWKLERNETHNVSWSPTVSDRSKMQETVQEAVTSDKGATTASTNDINGADAEMPSSISLEKSYVEKYYAPQTVHELTTKLYTPKRERSEIQKIQRSFRRQAIWFFIFSVISLMITSGMFDIGEFAVAFPFLVLTLAGLTAFIMALRYMVKAKRLKKKKDALDESDNQTLEQLRRMKKIGFWSVMSGLGVVILSLILLIIWI